MESKLHNMLLPFKYRNYRMLMVSLALWLSAAWIANLSFGLIAKELHGDSPFYVGMVGFGFNFPVLIFILFGGVLADRYNRHKLMLGIIASFLIPCLVMALMLSFGMFRIAGLIGFIVAIIFMINLQRFRLTAKPRFVEVKILEDKDSLTKI